MLELSTAELLVEAKKQMQSMHYAYNTQRSYIEWIKRFLTQVDNSEGLLPADRQIESFLAHLSKNAVVSISTSNQARNALVFFYKQVLQHPLENTVNTLKYSKEKKLPIVLDHEEMVMVLKQLNGTTQIIVKLLYGSGLRITEAIRLRVGDVDFDNLIVQVRSADGKKQRQTPLSSNLIPSLQKHMHKIQLIHQQDLQQGFGANYIHDALENSRPELNREWQWQYLFPSRNLSVDSLANTQRRQHIDQSVVNKAIKSAMNKVNIEKKVSAHTFRHSFATHLLQKGVAIRRLQELMGHNNIETTKIYVQVLQRELAHISSPLDDLVLS